MQASGGGTQAGRRQVTATPHGVLWSDSSLRADLDVNLCRCLVAAALLLCCTSGAFGRSLQGSSGHLSMQAKTGDAKTVQEAYDEQVRTPALHSRTKDLSSTATFTPIRSQLGGDSPPLLMLL